MNQPNDLPIFPSIHEDRTDIVVVKAPPCPMPGHGPHLVTVPLDGLIRYEIGMGHIQDEDIFGCLTVSRRETLMSGSCDEAWDIMTTCGEPHPDHEDILCDLSFDDHEDGFHRKHAADGGCQYEWEV